MSNIISYKKPVGEHVCKLTDGLAGAGAIANDKKLIVSTVGVSVLEEGSEFGFRYATIELKNYSKAITQSTLNGWYAIELGSFAKGRIGLISAVIESASISAVDDDMTDGAGAAISLGTAATANTTLDGTAANLVASTAFDTLADKAANLAAKGVNVTAATLDGSATAIKMYLNGNFSGDKVGADNIPALLNVVLKVKYHIISES